MPRRGSNIYKRKDGRFQGNRMKKKSKYDIMKTVSKRRAES